MSSYNVRGSAEPSHIIFAQAGIKYEDNRFKTEQWDNEVRDGIWL